MKHFASAAVVVLAVTSATACGKQEDCDHARKILNENHAAMQSLHQQLQQLNPKSSTERVRADRIKEEVRDIAKAAEKLTVKTEQLIGPVATYREGLQRASEAAAEMSQHTTTLSRIGPASEKTEATADNALRALESACADARGSCADIKAILSTPSPKPDEVAEATAHVTAIRTKLEALKIEDPALARTVQSAIVALIAQEKDYEAMAAALDGLVKATRSFDKALDSAGEVHRTIEALCE